MGTRSSLSPAEAARRRVAGSVPARSTDDAAVATMQHELLLRLNDAEERAVAAEKKETAAAAKLKAEETSGGAMQVQLDTILKQVMIIVLVLVLVVLVLLLVLLLLLLLLTPTPLKDGRNAADDERRRARHAAQDHELQRHSTPNSRAAEFR